MKPATFFASSFLISLFLGTCLVSWISPYGPNQIDMLDRLSGPTFLHWLGTDELGRDILTRILYGARLSIVVAFLATFMILGIATPLGALAGFRGGRMDRLFMSVVDFFYTFPPLLLAMLIMLYFGRGLVGLALSLALTSWVTHARIIRGEVLRLREMEFITASRSIGSGILDIFRWHLIPNLRGIITVSITILVPQTVLAESFLSFIGLGVEPPQASWGTLIRDGFDSMRDHPHLLFFPGASLYLTLLSFFIVSDRLKQKLR